MEFYVIPDMEEEIRITFDVFWKQKNVYLLANVQNKEDIEVTVTDGVRNVIAQEVFYTTTGMKFNGVGKHTYRIRVSNRGGI